MELGKSTNIQRKWQRGKLMIFVTSVLESFLDAHIYIQRAWLRISQEKAYKSSWLTYTSKELDVSGLQWRKLMDLPDFNQKLRRHPHIRTQTSSQDCSAESLSVFLTSWMESFHTHYAQREDTLEILKYKKRAGMELPNSLIQYAYKELLSRYCRTALTEGDFCANTRTKEMTQRKIEESK